jgi:hypothetical protein
LCENGIQIGGITNRTLDQLIDLLGRAGANKENTDSYEKEKKDGRNEEKGFDFQKRIPFTKEWIRIIIEEKLLLYNLSLNPKSSGSLSRLVTKSFNDR